MPFRPRFFTRFQQTKAGCTLHRVFRLLPARHRVPEVLKMVFMTASIVTCCIYLKSEGMPKLVLGPNLKRMIRKLTGGPEKKDGEDGKVGEDEEDGEGDMGSGPWF